MAARPSFFNHLTLQYNTSNNYNYEKLTRTTSEHLSCRCNQSRTRQSMILWQIYYKYYILILKNPFKTWYQHLLDDLWHWEPAAGDTWHPFNMITPSGMRIFYETAYFRIFLSKFPAAVYNNLIRHDKQVKDPVPEKRFGLNPFRAPIAIERETKAVEPAGAEIGVERLVTVFSVEGGAEVCQFGVVSGRILYLILRAGIMWIVWYFRFFLSNFGFSAYLQLSIRLSFLCSPFLSIFPYYIFPFLLSFIPRFFHAPFLSFSLIYFFLSSLSHLIEKITHFSHYRPSKRFWNATPRESIDLACLATVKAWSTTNPWNTAKTLLRNSAHWVAKLSCCYSFRWIFCYWSKFSVFLKNRHVFYSRP